ncbi:MAG: N-acetylglucosamine-6-phosphate deacetylase [Acidimicrobiales bacterium]
MLVGIASTRVARRRSAIGDGGGGLDGVGGLGGFAPATVWVDTTTGVIESVEQGAGRAGAEGRTDRAQSRSRLLDVGDRRIAPGFVDVHVHGGGGSQVNAASAEESEAAAHALASFHARHGTTALLATTVSDSPDRLAATVAGIARATRAPRTPDGARGANGEARVLGCHLEGPFISSARAGAQDPRAIRAPDRDELRRLLEIGDGTVRLVTLAPELPGAIALIGDCLDAGAAVALGHTDATFEVALSAFEAGATHVSHLFNAMAPIHHRAPGLLGAALTDERATLELICDLHHVHPAVIDLAVRVAAARLVLATDATSAAGGPPGPHMLGTVPAVLDGTRVSLESDPTVLAGSVLVMDRAVANAVDASCMPLDVALRAASAVPAALAWPTVRPTGSPAVPGGSFLPGAPADLVVLEETLTVAATVVGGTVVFDPGGLLSRL